MIYNEANASQTLFNADAPYIYDGKGNYTFSLRSLAILFNKVIEDNKFREFDKAIIKAQEAPKPKKPVDWPKAAALKKAGWSYKAIAEELGIEERMVSIYFEARKAHMK